MVKGITRQVIVVQSPGEEIFDQAIFILKDSAVKEGVTDEKLLREAKRCIRGDGEGKPFHSGPVWACGGAVFTALLWLATVLL